IQNVYAIGDCVELKYPTENRKSIEAVWYAGRMRGETVAQTICGNPTKYKPGAWLNSAKFFDIEYQTYGYVSNILKENQSAYYVEEEINKRCLKMVYHTKTKVVIGINALGIRLRHEKVVDWLNKQLDLNFYLNNFKQID